MKRVVVLVLICAVLGGVGGKNDVLANEIDIDGRLAFVLAAEPRVADPTYRESVLLVARLADDGHVGVIVNRPTEVKLDQLFPEDESSRSVREPVYFGGPMLADVLLAAATGDEAPGAGTFALGQSWFLTLDAEVIDVMIRSRPNDARYFIGMVLWRPGELRAELREGYWSVPDVSPERVFHGATDALWRDLADTKGQRTLRVNHRTDWP